MKKLLFLLALSLLFMTSCDSEEPTLIGHIITIDYDLTTSLPSMILVDGTDAAKKDPSLHGMGYITIDNTVITGGKLKDLALDMEVEIYFEGPVLESYPVQGKARKINIVQ